MKRTKSANGRYRTEFEKEDLKRLYKLYVVDQLSIHDTAAKMKVKSNIIQRYVEEKGWVRKKSDMGIKGDTALKVIDLYVVKKWTAEKIGIKYKVSTQTILNVLRDHNVKRTKQEAHKLRGITTRNLCIAKFVDMDCRSFPEYRYACYRLLSSLWPVVSYIVDVEAKKVLYSNYHVDHMLSVYEGFKNNIPLAIVAHPANYKVITAKENNDKSIKSSITLSKLKKRIKEYDEEYGNPFKEAKRKSRL